LCREGEESVTASGSDVYDLGDELLPLEALRNTGAASPPSERGGYSRGEVRVLVEEYARLYSGSAAPKSSLRARREGMGQHAVLVRLWDLERALSALPADAYVAVELCGLRGMTFDEAGQMLAVGRSTVNDRFAEGLRLLEDQLSQGASSSRSLREGDWKTWVSEDRHVLDPHPEAEFSPLATDHTGPISKRRKDRTAGRPPQIPLALETRIADFYRDGLTLQAIADLLNQEDVSAPGKEWRPSTLRRALKRQDVPTRRRGRQPRKGSVSFGTR
jgi:hypothetical protein